MPSVGQWIDRSSRSLERSSVPEPRANAEFLVAHVLGKNRLDSFLMKDAPLSPARAALLKKLIARRRRRIPLGYVLGSQEFLDIKINVDERVLIPRPETEELFEAACAPYAGGAPPPRRILDIATGSGALAIALAKRFPSALITATDINSRALQLARSNARRHGVCDRIAFLKEDALIPRSRTPLQDLVVSNPPYIPSSEISKLSPEVRHEPRQALDGGPDGLQMIRAVAQAAAAALLPRGRLFMEIGSRQTTAVRSILRKTGFTAVRVARDFAGLPRIAQAKKQKETKGHF